MLSWEPSLGAFVHPVGVFGVLAGPGVVPYVSWVPMTYERATVWRRRLARRVTAELIEDWVVAGQVAEVSVADGVRPLPEIVEALLTGLLVEVLPVFEWRRGW
jgi:hypothetical protein